MLRDQLTEGADDMVIEHYNMDDVDAETLRAYRMRFQNENGSHLWNTYDDKHFLEMLGGYRKDRDKGIEGLTLAVLPKLTGDLPKPFKLDGYVREDDTPLHKAVIQKREIRECRQCFVWSDLVIMRVRAFRQS